MTQIIEFLRQNAGTIIVLAVLVSVLALVIARVIHNKKRGVGSCSCGCADCPMSAICTMNQKTDA